jgi:hypothetical protein
MGGGVAHLTERLGGGLQAAVQRGGGVHADGWAALGAAYQRTVHARVHRRHGVVAARVSRAERGGRVLRIPSQQQWIRGTCTAAAASVRSAGDRGGASAACFAVIVELLVR